MCERIVGSTSTISTAQGRRPSLSGRTTRRFPPRSPPHRFLDGSQYDGEDYADSPWSAERATVSPRSSRSRPASCAALRFAEILLPADGHVGDEHDTGVPIEQRPESGEDRLHFFFWDDRHDHFETFLLAEHEVCFMHPAMAFSRHVADDRVAGRFDLVQQLRHERPVFSRHDYADFFHRMQGQTTHRRLLSRACLGVNALLRWKTIQGAPRSAG